MIIKAYWHAQHMISPYPGSLRTGYMGEENWQGFRLIDIDGDEKHLSPYSFFFKLFFFFYIFFIFIFFKSWLSDVMHSEPRGASIQGQHLHESKGTSGTSREGEGGDKLEMERGEKHSLQLK